MVGSVVFGGEGNEGQTVVPPAVLDAAYTEYEVRELEAAKAPLEGRLGKLNEIMQLQLEIAVEDFVKEPPVSPWQESINQAGAIMLQHGRADRAQYVDEQAQFARSLTGGFVMLEKPIRVRTVRVPMRRTHWSDMWAEGDEDYADYGESIAPIYSEQDEEGNPLGVKWSVRFDGKIEPEVIDSSEATAAYPVEMKKKLDGVYEAIKLELAAQGFSDRLAAGRKEVVEDFKGFSRLSKILEGALDNYLILDHGRENDDTRKYRDLLAELQSKYLQANLNDNMTWITPWTQEVVLEALARLSRGDPKKLDEFRDQVKEALKSKDLFKSSKETIMRVFAALPLYKEAQTTPTRETIDSINDKAVDDMGASFLGKARYKLALASSDY